MKRECALAKKLWDEITEFNVQAFKVNGPDGNFYEVKRSRLVGQTMTFVVDWKRLKR